MTEQDWLDALDLNSTHWVDIPGWVGWKRWVPPGQDETILFRSETEVTGWSKDSRSIKVSEALKSIGVPDSAIVWFCLKHGCS